MAADTHTKADHSPTPTEPEPEPNQNEDSPHQPTDDSSGKPPGLIDDEWDDVPDEEIELDMNEALDVLFWATNKGQINTVQCNTDSSLYANGWWIDLPVPEGTPEESI